MHQVIIDLGTLKLLGLEIPLRIFGYGLMLVFGFLSGIALARWRARRAGENPDAISQCAIMALIGGVLGARILYICLYWDNDFLDSAGNFRFFELFNVTSGGLVYFGGLLGGAITVLGYIFYKKLPVRRFIDILAPSLMIGLAFGRMGCTLNGCCWGGPCEANWALGMKFPMISRPLLKIGGDSENPYSPNQGLSPTFAHQYWRGEVQPDARLLNQFVQVQAGDDKVYGDGKGKGEIRRAVLPVDQLHGPLEEDQLEIMFGSQILARDTFEAIVGAGGSIGKEDWGLARTDKDKKHLRGSEPWAEGIQFDHSQDGRLDFEEFWFYMQDRKRLMITMFDADGDAKLTGKEYDQANKYLQADLFEILAAQWSNPRKPAQVLGIINGFLLTALLLGFYRYRKREGQVLALMLILYPITRFLLESLRHDDPLNVLHGNWTHNQISSLFMVAGGAVLWWILSRMSPSAGPVLAERQAIAIREVDKNKHNK